LYLYVSVYIYGHHRSYAQVLRSGMATAGPGGVGNSGSGNSGGATTGRGLGAGRGGGRSGGGGAVRSRQGYGAGYDYNHRSDDGAHFTGQRFSPNLGIHPPNFGPGWEYER
jgi:hypothetical protein